MRCSLPRSVVASATALFLVGCGPDVVQGPDLAPSDDEASTSRVGELPAGLKIKYLNVPVSARALPTRPAPAYATIVGSDLGGGDLTPADGDVLSGSFTNVGTFLVPPGATVYVTAGADLSVSASAVIIAGTLDATGAGYAGGATSAPGILNGNPGSGPGGGQGALFGPSIHTPGGGGGGHGGAGGGGGQTLGSPAEALGGPAYGATAPPGALAGSGGGSAGNWGCCDPASGGPGGAGGGAVIISAGSINVSGAIVADGANGGLGTLSPTFSAYRISGGGGGSGGGIWLDGALSLTGSLSAAGGSGGDANSAAVNIGWGNGGGGGAGGRIKLSGCTAVNTASFSVTGGAAGGNSGVFDTPSFKDPQGGADGTVADASEPTCVIEIAIDIKPGSNPNSVNIKSKGNGGNANVPVAILTTDDFDAATAVVGSLTFGDDVADAVGVIVKNNGTFQASLEDADGDGDLDLVVHFSRTELIASGDLTAASTQLCVNGVDTDGTPIHGCDSVNPVS